MFCNLSQNQTYNNFKINQQRSNVITSSTFDSHHFRTCVENAFGMLKGRFPALKALSPAENIQETYRDVAALLVIHNICIDLGDHPESVLNYAPAVEEPQDEGEFAGYGGNIGDDVEVNVPDGETDAALKRAGFALREQLLDELYPNV
ncbi:hypothetical protein APHAL10511_000879 [Amanita phalloides]|nr:hypothetical protein APHAL10511_000879 [Amanita phalloides]